MRESARAIAVELDHAGGDMAGAVAAGFTRDVEFGREGVEAALGGTLADVELGTYFPLSRNRNRNV